jgi:hypothetical protein
MKGGVHMGASVHPDRHARNIRLGAILDPAYALNSYAAITRPNGHFWRNS